MSKNTFVDNAKVTTKGQITIPKDIRTILGISNGDRVTFVVEGDTVRLVNSAVYAMRMLQTQMANQDKKSDIISEDDVIALVKEVRMESESE